MNVDGDDNFVQDQEFIDLGKLTMTAPSTSKEYGASYNLMVRLRGISMYQLFMNHYNNI